MASNGLDATSRTNELNELWEAAQLEDLYKAGTPQFLFLSLTVTFFFGERSFGPAAVAHPTGMRKVG